MNIIFRCLLTVYAFCITLFSIFAMSLTLQESVFKKTVYFWVNNVLYGRKYSITFFIIELIFLCGSVLFLISGFRKNWNKRLIVTGSELGKIRISFDTIESIVIGTVKKIQQVKELKVYVENRDDKLVVLVKMIVALEANIPTLVAEVQKKAKKAVEDNTGLTVAEVQVIVDDVSSTNKARVE